MANFFSKDSNFIPLKLAFFGGFVAVTVVLMVNYYMTDKTLAVGYAPSQPIPFDHSLHVQGLGLSCKKCHSFADKTGHANIPSAETCWECHSKIATDRPSLEPLRRAVDKNYEHYTGEPIKWTKIHQVPDYVYFNHSAHINRGISCVDCHGRVDKMAKVYRAKAHTMAMCLDCHNEPEKYLRPLEEVYNLDYTAKKYLLRNQDTLNRVNKFAAKEAMAGLQVNDSESKYQELFGKYLKNHWNISPKKSCATCHN